MQARERDSNPARAHGCGGPGALAVIESIPYCTAFSLLKNRWACSQPSKISAAARYHG
jgi:hypothetical protein